MGRPRKQTEGVTVTSIAIPTGVRDLINALADEQKVSISDLVRPVICDYFKPVPITEKMTKLDAESKRKLALSLSEIEEAKSNAEAKAAQIAADANASLAKARADAEAKAAQIAADANASLAKARADAEAKAAHAEATRKADLARIEDLWLNSKEYCLLKALEAVGMVKDGKPYDTERHAYRSPDATVETISSEYLVKQGIAALTDSDGTVCAFGEAAVLICQILNKRRYANNLHGALSEAVALKAVEVSEDWQDSLSYALSGLLGRRVTIEQCWAALGWQVINGSPAQIGSCLLKPDNGKRLPNYAVSDKLKQVCEEYGMLGKVGMLFV